MRTTSLVIAAAIAALGSTVGLAHGTPTRFTRDGVVYEYTSEVHHGRQVIAGRRLPGGEPFHLVVANGHVRGTSSGMPVAFDLAQATPGAVEIAAR